MSEVARRQVWGVEVVRLSTERAMFVGPPDRIDRLLDGLRQAGEIVTADKPVPDGRPGVYAVMVRFSPPPPPLPVPRPPFWTPRRIGYAAGTGVAVLAGAGVAAYIVMAWVVAHLAAMLTVLVLGGLVAGAFGPRVCKTVVTVIHKH
jgi:hypothetical protein